MKNRFLKVFIFFVGIAFLLSCTNNSIEKQDYIKYVTDKKNGMIKEVKTDSFLYNVQFVPKKLIIMKEHSNLNPDSIELFSNKYYKDLEFVKISIKDIDGVRTKLIYGSNANYSTLINYSSTGLKYDILMLDGNDTIPCFDTYFEPSYKIKSDYSYIFTFKRRNKSKGEYGNVNIIFFDRIFSKKQFDLLFNKKELNTINDFKII